MGGCLFASKDERAQILKKAYNVFHKIDINKTNIISSQQLQIYFGLYAQSSAKIILREIDINNDGVIGINQWLGYWEMVRRAGYKQNEILKQLEHILNRQISLNFPNVRCYQENVPRITVIKSIVDDLKRSPPQQLPFCLEQ